MGARAEIGELSPGGPVPSPGRRNCLLHKPGRMSYAAALTMQRDFHAACVSGRIPGVLILLEHDPVITLGVKTSEANKLAGVDLLGRSGVEVAETDRGGDATYHGPGQIVGYPIIRLRELCGDVHSYLRTLEQVVIDALAGFGLLGTRNGPAGVWVADQKVCSIGVAVRRSVTYHGFALNVDPDMSHFSLINPCGLRSEQITSLKMLLGTAPDISEVQAACASAFADRFGVNLAEWDGRLP